MTFMSNIKSPRRERDYADRLIDCQEAMESRFQQLQLVNPETWAALHNEAVAAGWTTQEVRASMLQLADAALSIELGDDL